jgi:hypothetical protein
VQSKKYLLILAVTLALVLLRPELSRSDDLWEGDEFLAFCKSLSVPKRELLAANLGPYLPVIEKREALDLNAARLADFSHIQPLLAEAAHRKWGALQFFTQSPFAEKSACLVMLDRNSLAEVDRVFDLHSLLKPKAAVSSDQNEELRMEFLLVGHGKLIVGYPKDAWVKLPDYALQAHYKSYISLQIDQQKNQRGLFEIRTLSRPGAEFESFLEARAPFIGITWPIQIHSLALGVDGPIVGYRLFGMEKQEQRRRIAITER